jgi:long-chain acyl-CoA synthetase
MNIIESFIKNVNKQPQKIAVIFAEEQVSYSELYIKVRNIAALLKHNGVKEGVKVIVLLPNSIEFLVLMLAIADLGAVLVPLSTTLSSEAVKKAAESSDCSFAVVNSSVIGKIPQDLIPMESVLVIGNKVVDEEKYLRIDDSLTLGESYELGMNNINPDSDYILTMTSGSTGNPKPIIFSQKTKINRGIDACSELYGINSNDIIIAASPLYHSLGQRLALFPMFIGATSVILGKFTPKNWLEAVEEHKVSFTIAVSSHLESILIEMLNHKYCINSLKTIVSSSALLKPEVKKKCLKYFKCDFHECYGASEVGIVTNLYPKDNGVKFNSVGKALPFVDMKIVDENKHEVSPETIGEIICKTSTAFSGYYKLPEKTSESVLQGYFYTGDLGKVDLEGYLYFCGRKKELIIVGGTNVYPGDVEQVINKCDEIKECAVIGIDDIYFGEAVVAVLIPQDGVDKKDALRAARKMCFSSLADYQQPMVYELLDALPKNALGKITKHKLKEQFKNLDPSAKFRAMRGLK